MSKIHLVLIEDHQLTLIGLRAAFSQQHDIEIVGEATNGQDGLKMIEMKQPDIAIVDIGLPDIDGISVVRRFRTFQEENALPKTKVVMLTMHDSEDSVLAAFAAGADSYCMKQTKLDVLMTATRLTYEGNSWIDPAIASIVLRNVARTSAFAVGASQTVSINAVSQEYEQILEVSPLTKREVQILELIVEGCSNAEIAERCYVTVGTVKTHVRNILNKLGVDDRTTAAVRALRAGLVS